MTRAEAGRQIDEIGDLGREITLSPAMTRQGAAVKLRRLLSVYLWGPEPARRLAGALEALEKAAAAQSLTNRL